MIHKLFLLARVAFYSKFLRLIMLLQVLVREFIKLHDKYMPYVNECFMRHILFNKVLLI